MLNIALYANTYMNAFMHIDILMPPLGMYITYNGLIRAKYLLGDYLRIWCVKSTDLN